MVGVIFMCVLVVLFLSPGLFFTFLGPRGNKLKKKGGGGGGGGGARFVS
eukprot:COSAG06_NODE_64304_length_260_cov_0.515528_1_plen_48_part_10